MVLSYRGNNAWLARAGLFVTYLCSDYHTDLGTRTSTYVGHFGHHPKGALGQRIHIILGDLKNPEEHTLVSEIQYCGSDAQDNVPAQITFT